MRIVPLKPFDEISFSDRADVVDYRTYLIHIVQHPGQSGFTPAAMRKIIKIVDVLEAAEGQDTVEIEDDHWTEICHRVNSFSYGFAHKELLAFIDDVCNAPEKEIRHGERPAE